MYNPYVKTTSWQNNPYYQEWMTNNIVDPYSQQSTPDASGQAPTESAMGGVDYGDAAKTAAIGLQSYANSKASTPSFTIDQTKGYTGSLSGLSSGGVYGAIAGGVGAQVGQFDQVNKNIKNLDKSVNVYDTVNGQPYYKGGAVIDANQKINALQRGENSLKTNNPFGETGQALTGLGMADPSTQVFAGLFGTKRKLRRAQSQIKQNLYASQTGYNQARSDYNQQQASLYDYYNRNQKRIRNLYE